MKIVISGAGIAGPTLAFWLLRQGHDITLIEQASQLRTGGYVIDFWGHGYTIAERMGILPQVKKAGYQVQEVRTVDREGRRTGGFPVEVVQHATQNRFTSLPRGDLAEILFRSVKDRVETLFDNSIASIEQHNTGVRTEFEQGPAREFDLVIGADGLHSKVRELVFGPESQFEKQLGYHVAAFQVSGYPHRDELIYLGYNQPGRMVARFSLRNDRTLFLFVMTDDRMHNGDLASDAERKATLTRLFPDAGWECPEILEAMQPVPEIYFDRVSQIRMDAWSKGRVLLLGDAAACVSLLAGEGTGLAMTEAYVLAGELQRAGNDYRTAFTRYEKQLRPFIADKQKSARNFAGAFAPRTRFGIWSRNQMSKLIALPGVGSYFISRSVRDDFDLPDVSH